MGVEAGCAHEKGQRLAECRALAFGFRGGVSEKRALLAGAVLQRFGKPPISDRYQRQGDQPSRGAPPCFDRYQKWSDRVVMGWRSRVGLPCVCNDPVEIRSIGVDQQEFDAAGFGVGTAAGGLFRFAHDDAFGRDAFGDEGITNAKGALFGQVSVEGGITSGVVVNAD